MSNAAARAERQSAMLDELAELGLALARDLQRRALQAEAPQEAASLADAFHRVARSVRQSLALQARLAREVRQDVADEQVEADRERRVAAHRRKKVLAEALERIVWTECEADEAENLARCIGFHIEGEIGRGGFLTTDVETLIRRICREMELAESVIEGLPLAEICREAEEEVDAAARIKAHHETAPLDDSRAFRVAPLSQQAWRSSA